MQQLKTSAAPANWTVESVLNSGVLLCLVLLVQFSLNFFNCSPAAICIDVPDGMNKTLCIDVRIDLCTDVYVSVLLYGNQLATHPAHIGCIDPRCDVLEVVRGKDVIHS